MSEEINANVTNEDAVDEKNEKDIRQEVQDVIFQTLKDKVKGHIYVKVEERTDEVSVDSVFVSIINFGIKYDYRMRLEGKTYEMISTNNDFARTLALMIFDNYKQYINIKMFVNDSDVNDRRNRSKHYNKYNK